MGKKVIYLACPYWSEDPIIRNERFQLITYVAGVLMDSGYIVFSPITHSVPIQGTRTQDETHEFWLEQDFYWLECSDEVWVLNIDGVDNSYGVWKEVAHAHDFSIDVKYINISNGAIVQENDDNVLLNMNNKTMEKYNVAKHLPSNS